MTNLKLYTFSKHAGCPSGEWGHQGRGDNDGQGGGGLKNLTVCQTSFVNGPLYIYLSSFRLFLFLDSLQNPILNPSPDPKHIPNLSFDPNPNLKTTSNSKLTLKLALKI